MSKILIEKQLLLDRITELETIVDTDVFSETWDMIEGEKKFLQYILQQGKEYKSEKLLKEVIEQIDRFDENEAIEFAEWILKSNYGSDGSWKINRNFNNTWSAGQVEEGDKDLPSEELFKLYKDEKNNK